MSGKKDWSKIKEVVEKIENLGLKFNNGAEQFGVKLRDIYECNRRIKRGAKSDGEGLLEPSESCKVKISPSKEKESEGSMPKALEEVILNYRKQNPDYGYKRIQDFLKSKHFVVVKRKKIRELLKSHGLCSVNDSSFDSGKESEERGSRRFEASYPRELYQMDVTYVYLKGHSVFYCLGISKFQPLIESGTTDFTDNTDFYFF